MWVMDLGLTLCLSKSTPSNFSSWAIFLTQDILGFLVRLYFEYICWEFHTCIWLLSNSDFLKMFFSVHNAYNALIKSTSICFPLICPLPQAITFFLLLATCFCSPSFIPILYLRLSTCAHVQHYLSEQRYILGPTTLKISDGPSSHQLSIPSHIAPPHPGHCLALCKPWTSPGNCEFMCVTLKPCPANTDLV